MAEEKPRAGEASPQENPTSKPDDLGRFTSLEAKQRSLQNLKPPFKQGQPAPAGAGRPKKDGIFTSTARRFARKRFPGDAADRTYGQLVVEAMFKQAIKGNVFAAQLLFERLEGRMPMPIEGDLPCQITVVVNRNQPRYPQIELPKKDAIMLEADTSSRAND